MMEASAKIITGFTNSHHISQISESLIWDSLFGSENRVLRSGSSLAIDVTPKKGIIRILDGIFIFSKRLGVVEKSDTVTFTPMLSDTTYCKIGVAIQYLRTAQSQGGYESFTLVGSVSPSFTSKTQAENYVVSYNGTTQYNTTISTSSTALYRAYFPLYEVIVNASSVVSSRRLFETLSGISEDELLIRSRLGPGFLESFYLSKAELERTVSEQETNDKKRVSDIAKERQTADTNVESSITSYIPVQPAYGSKDLSDLCFVRFSYYGCHEVVSISDISGTSYDGDRLIQYRPTAAHNPFVETKTVKWRDLLGWDHNDDFDFVRFAGHDYSSYIVFRHDGVLEPDQVRGVTILKPSSTYEGDQKNMMIKTKGGTT